MSFKVNYDALDGLYNGINTQTSNWLQRLEALQSVVETLAESGNISGKGADNIKQYISSVHGTIIGLLANVLSLHSANCLLYKQDYQQNVDTDLHAIIHETELSDIKTRIDSSRTSAISINDQVENALAQVRDIFYCSYKDVSSVDAAHKSVSEFLTDLSKEITALESKHASLDFQNTEQMISTLKSFISEQHGKGRSYKQSFSSEDLANSSAFRQVYESYVSVNDELENKSEAIETAIENENQRAAALQEEYEERQRKATIINWVVTGVCVIGSIAAIAATGGAATPLVVAGISAASSAIIAGTKNVTGQYVENGSLNNLDLMSLGKDVLVGAATGFATGYLGASVGGAITSGLSKTALGSTLLNSSNAVVRVGTGAVIGSASEVGSGIVSRGVSATVQGVLEGDLGKDNILSEMFDGQSILLDGMIGAFSGGVVEYKQYKADMAVRNYNEAKNPVDHATKRGYDLKSGKNGTLEYSGTDYIKTSSDGKEIIVEIEATGSRSKDFSKAWDLAESNYGVSKSDFSNVTWQHMDDYNVRTNKFTLELVDRGAHQGISHAGGCKQYEVFKGIKYK